MIVKRTLIISLVFVLLFAACTGLSAAGEFVAGNVADVQQGTTVPVGVYGTNMNGFDAFTIRVTYDPTVMLVTAKNSTYNPDEWSIFPNVDTPGIVDVSGFPNSPADSLSGNASLFGFNCRAEKGDGSSTPLTVTITTASEPGGATYTAVNGLFTTKDEVAPTIVITNPANGATVPNNVAVAATITDVGGVDQSTITVTVGGVAIASSDLTITTIAGGCIVAGTQTGVPVGPSTVVVSASDFSGNPATVTHTVTVANSGITFNPNLDGTYTNATEPVIKADYVQVTGTTVKMFINNVDVTTQATLTPSSTTAGSIELNYATYGALADGQQVIVVNGTSSLLGGSEVTATQTFVKDTVAPVVVITSITDSDTDGYLEARETLTIAYTVTDVNPDHVGIGSASSAASPTGNLVYGVAQGNTLGNRDAYVYAVDRAGNRGQSAPFHLYNNYLAYFNETSAGTFAGLDLTKTATYNYFEPSVARAITISGQSGSMNLPTLGTFEKTVISGSNVTVDNRANNAISTGTMPAGVPNFINSTGILNFAVTVPHIDNATLIIGKANSTMIDQILRGGSVSKASIENMLSKDNVVIYGKDGYRILKIKNDGTAEVLAGGKGAFTFNTDLPTTIRANYVNLDTGFNTATKTPELGLEISKIGAGEYVILAITLDNDRISAITAMPFVVTEELSKFTALSPSYSVGNPVVVNWNGAAVPQNIAGVIIRDGSLYTGSMTMDLTNFGVGSLKSMYLSGDGNPATKKLINKANIWISEGYGNANKATNTKTVSIATTGLIAGTYTVHMMNENGGKLTAYGTQQITVGPTPIPTSPIPGRGGGSYGGGAPTKESVGSAQLLTNSLGQILNSYSVGSPSGVASLNLGIGTVALDKNGISLSDVAINDLAAASVPGVPSGATFSFAGHAVTCSPAGATFSPPLQLTFEFTQDQWNGVMAQAKQNPSSLVVKWYNPESGEWEDVQTSVNEDSRTVTASVHHFSTFALFTDLEATTPVVTPTMTPVVTPVVTPVTTPTPTEPTGGFPWTYVIIGIVVILLIAGGAYYYTRKQ
jgi:hypothetical protein